MNMSLTILLFLIVPLTALLVFLWMFTASLIGAEANTDEREEESEETQAFRADLRRSQILIDEKEARITDLSAAANSLRGEVAAKYRDIAKLSDTLLATQMHLDMAKNRSALLAIEADKVGDLRAEIKKLRADNLSLRSELTAAANKLRRIESSRTYRLLSMLG